MDFSTHIRPHVKPEFQIMRELNPQVEPRPPGEIAPPTAEISGEQLDLLFDDLVGVTGDEDLMAFVYFNDDVPYVKLVRQEATSSGKQSLTVPLEDRDLFERDNINELKRQCKRIGKEVEKYEEEDESDEDEDESGEHDDESEEGDDESEEDEDQSEESDDSEDDKVDEDVTELYDALNNTGIDGIFDAQVGLTGIGSLTAHVYLKNDARYIGLLHLAPSNTDSLIIPLDDWKYFVKHHLHELKKLSKTAKAQIADDEDASEEDSNGANDADDSEEDSEEDEDESYAGHKRRWDESEDDENEDDESEDDFPNLDRHDSEYK